MWYANLIRLLADAPWALLNPFEYTVKRADLPSCFLAAGFNGMTFLFKTLVLGGLPCGFPNAISFDLVALKATV